MNTDALKQNIKDLMQKKSITQEKLAEILRMSQSNVSKALSKREKNIFTLEQIVMLSEHFGVSVDNLLGIKHSKDDSYSPRYVAEFLVKMIEAGDAEFFVLEKEEKVYERNNSNSNSLIEEETKTIKYPAFYLKNYNHIPSYADDDEILDLLSLWGNVGNDTKMICVNQFLNSFLEVHSIYNSKALSKETYDTVVNDLLSHVPDSFE